MNLLTVIMILWVGFFTYEYFKKPKPASCEADVKSNKLEKRISLLGICFGLFIYALAWILVIWVYV